MDNIAPNVAANSKSGFRKCVIVPFNVEELFSRIPRKGCSANDVHSSFLEDLGTRRQDLTKTTKTLRKKLTFLLVKVFVLRMRKKKVGSPK